MTAQDPAEGLCAVTDRAYKGCNLRGKSMATTLKDIRSSGGGGIAGLRERDVRVTDTVNQMAVSLKETAGFAESVAGSAEELASSVNEMAASIEQVTGSAASLAATAN